METIVATAFGRKLDVIGGEADDLTKTAQGFFEQTEEGSSTSRDKLVMLTSKLVHSFLAVTVLVCALDMKSIFIYR